MSYFCITLDKIPLFNGKKKDAQTVTYIKDLTR